MEGSYVLKIHEIVFPRRRSDWFLEVGENGAAWDKKMKTTFLYF
jgi:hypothetical protein